MSSFAVFAPRWGAPLLFLLLAISACQRSPSTPQPSVTVYKTESCHCCQRWVEHLQGQGFQVQVQNERAINPLKKKLGVPEALWSCHTATVGGYIIEGHVPAQDIRRLLAERPAAMGLAVPGMPIGSPGMEQGNQQDAYETLLFGPEGTRVFARH